jgi:hypothetical protein
MTAAPNDPHMGLVVEGPGDAVALPILLRAHLRLSGEYRDVLGKPVACNGKPKALMPGGVEGKVATATARPGCRGVVVVLDADADPSCQLGPQLAARSAKVSRVPVVVAVAEPKFEAWLVASAETLGLPGLTYVEARDPETMIKNALAPAKYVKPTWQPRLAHKVDVTLAASRRPCLARLLARFDELRSVI